VPSIDWGLLETAGIRLSLVATALATLLTGASIRYAIRAAGWPRWSVRLATTVTWAVAIGLPARLLLLPLDGDLERLVYQALLAASVPILAFWAFGLDATRRAIDRRRTRRVEMFAAIQAIHDSLGSVETAEDRERLDGTLADLDRFVEPATFEYIQLTRSRILSWLDAGPLAAEREARWSARVAELVETLRPESWWQADPPSRVGQRLRGLVLSRAPLLAAASGIILGRSALIGPAALAMPAAVVAGYLLTWEWYRTATVLLTASAAGLVVTALAGPSQGTGGELATVGIVAAALGWWAAIEWRRARRRPDLRLLPAPEESSPERPRAG
jgi:hypothetical protein